jgi:tape measure domain-containing protein
MQTGMQFQQKRNAINFGTGGRGDEAISAISKETDRLGINTQSSIEGFRTLSGALRGMALPKQIEIFKGVSAGVAAMGLSGEDAKGTFLALGQIASKGTVSAEELRGQIGERVPGAFGIAAKAMGVTEQKLGDMMKKGEIASNVFLPKFAAEMQKTFGVAAANNVNSANANFERFNNTLFDLKVTIANDLLPVAIPFLKDYIIPATKWITAHAAGLIKLVGVVAAVIAIVKVWTIAQWLLNVALTANPIGLIVVGIAAAIAGITALVFWIKKARESGESWWDILKQISWVLYNISTLGIPMLIEKLSGGFKSAGEKAMDTLKETIKAGVSTNEMAEFFKKVGELHGVNYMSAMIDKVGQAAAWADRFYNTNFFSNKLQDVKTGMYGKGGVVTAPPIGPKGQYNFNGAGLDESAKNKVKEHTDSITGGGAKNIYITLGKFQDQLNIHTMTVKEGVNEMEQMIENSLLRILNSANAISN